jgi:hypothetical protein
VNNDITYQILVELLADAQKDVATERAFREELLKRFDALSAKVDQMAAAKPGNGPNTLHLPAKGPKMVSITITGRDQNTAQISSADVTIGTTH